jgi:hypothetical protein
MFVALSNCAQSSNLIFPTTQTSLRFFHLAILLLAGLLTFLRHGMHLDTQSESHTTFECPGCRTRYADSDIPSLLDPIDNELKYLLSSRLFTHSRPRCSLESCGAVLVRDHASISAAADAARHTIALYALPKPLPNQHPS